MYIRFSQENEKEALQGENLRIEPSLFANIRTKMCFLPYDLLFCDFIAYFV